MTESAFILDIQNELTYSCSLPQSLPPGEILRIINRSANWFYDNYDRAVEKRYLYLPLKFFNDPAFKEFRELKLPDCIRYIGELREIRGGSIFGTLDRDFSTTKFIGSEVFLNVGAGEGLAQRTIMFSFLDLAKSFVLETVAFSYNKNTHKLFIMGHTPRVDVVALVFKNIEKEALYEDDYFQRFVRAEAKIRLGNMLGTYDYTLAGGIKLNVDRIIANGEKELQEVKDRIKSEGTPSFMFFTH